MTSELKVMKIEREHAQGKVTQMEAIKQVMDQQLKNATEEMHKFRTKAEETQMILDTDRQAFDERKKKLIKTTETNKMFEERQK